MTRREQKEMANKRTRQQQQRQQRQQQQLKKQLTVAWQQSCDKFDNINDYYYSIKKYS